MQNILLVCLDKQFSREIAQLLCEKLGKFYLDCEDLLEYELANKDDILKNCGLEYLEKLEHKFIFGILDYENTIMAISYDLYIKNKNFE